MDLFGLTLYTRMDANNTTWWSVVITNLPKQVNQHTIKPQVQMIDEDGQPQYRDDGIVPMCAYVQDSDMPNVMHTLISRWSTKQQHMEEFRKDKQLLYFTNALKSLMNNKKTAISWHDGDTDPNCSYHGYHLHMMIGITTKGPICDNYDYKKLNNIAKSNNIIIDNQRIIHPIQFLNYLGRPPRIPGGTNCQYLLDNFRQQDLPQEPPAKKGRYEKQTQLQEHIIALKTMMNKYDTTDKYGLFTAAKNTNNKDDEQMLRNLIRHQNWKRVYQVAIEERDIDYRLEKKAYYDIFMAIPKIIPGRKQMSYEQTQQCFLEWCFEQRIDALKFLISAYLVLTMKIPKKNTLYLCGRSNAGKTYFTNALLPLTHHIGSHITSKDFAFQECLTKPVILISELTIATQEAAEQYKQVFAGETIFVNVKNRNAEILTRKPVILTTNQHIWRHIPQERDAFKNRCFIFDNLTTTNVIGKYVQYGAASHTYFQHMFQLIDIHANTMNIKPEDLLKDSTLHELRPIPNATESDNDPIDLFHEFTQPDSIDDTEEYIIITDDECDTSNPYNIETDIDSPLFRPQPIVKSTQTSISANDKSTQTDIHPPSAPKPPNDWVYVTPPDQLIHNPYTPPELPKSPRKRLFFHDKPSTEDIDMEIALLNVLSPRCNSTPYELIEYPLVNVAVDIPSPVPESIDIQSIAFLEPYTDDEEHFIITRL